MALREAWVATLLLGRHLGIAGDHAGAVQHLRAAGRVPDDPDLTYTTSLLANLCPDAYSERTSRTPR